MTTNIQLVCQDSTLNSNQKT